MILDLTLIGEMTAIVTTTMQAIKSHPKVKGSVIPYLSGGVGVVCGLGWFLVTGELESPDSILHVDWADTFRGIFNGVAGAVSANAGYNIQKFLPIPNILPTAGEMDAAKIKEELATKELVVEAVKEGIPPEDAKESIGLEPEDPPPTSEVVEEAATEQAAEDEEIG